MSGVPNNPPAFPRPGFDNPAGMEDGMTLRDYLAGQALTGYLAGIILDPVDATPVNAEPMAVARMAYAYADAMLAARSGGDHA